MLSPQQLQQNVLLEDIDTHGCNVRLLLRRLLIEAENSGVDSLQKEFSKLIQSAIRKIEGGRELLSTESTLKDATYSLEHQFSCTLQNISLPVLFGTSVLPMFLETSVFQYFSQHQAFFSFP